MRDRPPLGRRLGELWSGLVLRLSLTVEGLVRGRRKDPGTENHPKR